MFIPYLDLAKISELWLKFLRPYSVSSLGYFQETDYSGTWGLVKFGVSLKTKFTIILLSRLS
jgi:hypothetical protein